MQVFHPNGQQIVGTADTIAVRSEIHADSFEKRPGGKVEFEWEGETEVFWDSQETTTRDGERLFLTYEGEECKESELIFK